MRQETVTTSIPKEYEFKMSDTKIHTLSKTEGGVVFVSGQTRFEVEACTSTSGNFVLPDFTETLSGTMKLSQETPIVELRKIPIQEAKNLIYNYIKKCPGSRTSDLIIELALDPDLVIEALCQLRAEERIGGKEIGTK